MGRGPRFVAVVAAGLALSQGCAPVVRHGVKLRLDTFPQSSPQTSLKSAIRAIEAEQPDYVLAHLVAPRELERAFRESGQSFEGILQTSRMHTRGFLEELNWFYERGKWRKGHDRAIVAAKGTSPQYKGVYMSGATLEFVRIDDRWFIGRMRYQTE